MEIIIKCSGCNKILNIEEVYDTATHDGIILRVKPCKNIDCNNCEDCEEVNAGRELRDRNQELRDKLSTIKGVLIEDAEEPKQISESAHIDK